MKSKAAFTKKDIAVALCCVVFVLMNAGAIGSGGRRRAREAVCLSNLRQWGNIFQMFTNDNNGYFPDNGKWVQTLYNYYGRSFDFLLCPSASKRNPGFGYSHTWGVAGTTKYAWWFGQPKTGPAPDGRLSVAMHTYFCPIIQSEPEKRIHVYGSYGINLWVYNADGYNPFGWKRTFTGKTWKHTNVEGADNIPLFLGSVWPSGAPEHSDSPMAYPEDLSTLMTIFNDMRRYTIDRHNGAVNCLFMDLSVRKVSLKCLWYLKWHRKFDTNAVKPTWTGDDGAWMVNFSEDCGG